MNNNGAKYYIIYQKYGHTTEYRIKTKASSQTINIHTVYNINIYIITPTPTINHKTNLETRKHKFNFQFVKERTRTNTYIHTHTRYIQERRIHFLTYIYREEERNIYQVGLVVSKPIST